MSFDAPGPFEPRLEPVWKEDSEPPEVTEIREVWEFPGARLVSSDGSEQAFWTEWRAFANRLRSRDPGFTSARLIRDPDGAAEVVWTLGPPAQEGFKVEQLGAGTDDLLPSSTWRVLAPVTLVLSAVQRFPDPNGIVGWRQEVSSTYDAGGLHELEWQTRITTREGVNAVEKVRTLGKIDIRPFGAFYSYDTNGPAGVEVSALDADEPKGRKPTRAVAVSRIRQWGVRVGAIGPGTSPTEVTCAVTTQVKGDERSTVVRATARGPGAERWVAQKAPAGAVSESEVVYEKALRQAEGTWIVRGSAPTASGDEARREIKAELAGGHVDFDYEPVVGGYEPVLFEGARLPWKLTVLAKVWRVGGEGSPAELKFPRVLPDPWRLDRNASKETEPVLEQPGATAESHRWSREASLVYYSPKRPRVSPLKQLKEGSRVTSYYLAGYAHD